MEMETILMFWTQPREHVFAFAVNVDIGRGRQLHHQRIKEPIAQGFSAQFIEVLVRDPFTGSILYGYLNSYSWSVVHVGLNFGGGLRGNLKDRGATGDLNPISSFSATTKL